MNNSIAYLEYMPPHIHELNLRIQNILNKHPNAARDTVIYYFIDDNIHFSHGMISYDTFVFAKGELVFNLYTSLYIPGEWEQQLKQLEAAL